MTTITGHDVGRRPHNGTFDYFTVFRIGRDGFKRIGNFDYLQKTEEICNYICSFRQQKFEFSR